MGEVTEEFQKGFSTASYRGDGTRQTQETTTLHPILLRFDDYEVFPPTILHQAETSIGRGDGCDIMVASETVSRRHAIIRYENWENPEEEPRCRIRDHGSKNGVFLNNVRIHGDAPLRPRDIVRLGEIIFGYFVRSAEDLKPEGQFISQLERRMVHPGAVRLRHPVHSIRVDLRVDGEGGPPVLCRATNLSLEGLGLSTERLTSERYAALLRNESPVSMVLHLPDSAGVLELQGRIAWLRLDDVRRNAQCNFGIELSGLDVKTEETLQGLFLRHSHPSDGRAPQGFP